MPRIAHIIAPNFPHHVTQRGNNGAVVFFDDEDRQTYLKLLELYNIPVNGEARAYFATHKMQQEEKSA
jgi:putative transposase